VNEHSRRKTLETPTVTFRKHLAKMGGGSYHTRVVLLGSSSADGAAVGFDHPEYQASAQFRRTATPGRFLLIGGVGHDPAQEVEP